MVEEGGIVAGRRAAGSLLTRRVVRLFVLTTQTQPPYIADATCLVTEMPCFFFEGRCWVDLTRFDKRLSTITPLPFSVFLLRREYKVLSRVVANPPVAQITRAKSGISAKSALNMIRASVLSH